MNSLMNPAAETKPERRQSILVVWHPDGYVEAFAERHIDVRFERVPVASSREAERLAEDLVAASLPKRYGDLYWPNKCRKASNLTPLAPSTLRRVSEAEQTLEALNGLMQQFAAEEELVAWTL